MRFEVLHSGSNAVVRADLERGEHIKAEPGAMVARSKKLRIHGRVWGGGFSALKRMFLGGDSFFFQEIHAEDGDGDVLIAPTRPGDIAVVPIEHDHDYYVKSGSLLAAFGAITMDTRMQKLTAGMFGGTGMFALHLRGDGHMVISAFGAILEVGVAAGEEYVIDNGHVVAWSADTELHVVKAGAGWVSSVTSGEGLGCKFVGPGKVWVQTRNPEAFGQWIRRFVPAR
ncbi:MAG: TIGR00266 family protein [Candidatus Obscuribacterales bacterium]|nr:TIGR00266 family protein [Candidatus Obscuribacterales bacterium]